MKKNAAIIFALCLFFTLLNGYCRAATIEQVAGVYSVWCDEKASIKGVGKMSSSEDSWIEITPGGTWLNEWGMQGTANIDEKGKQLYLTFDAAGIEELEDCLVDWAYYVASEEGISASELNFVVDAASMKLIKCKIDKNTNKLYKKFKIMAQGIYSGYLDGIFDNTKFTYKLTVTVISK
jgi:hypothetical protein